MLMKRNKFTGVLLSLLVALSLFLSSCTLSDNAKTEIEKVLKDYFSEIEDGDFAENDFESDYAKDTPFEDLSFADDRAKDAMLIGMEKFSYEIASIEASTSAGNGTCKVTITSLDIETIIEEIEEEETLTYEIFEEAISAKKAATDESDVTLKMSYNASAKEWTISDSEDMVEVFAEPYLDLTFGPKAGDPTETVAAFFQALADADEDALLATTTFYDFSDFFSSDETEAALVTASYQSISFEPNGDAEIGESTAEVPVSVTLVDIESVSLMVFEDETIVTDMIKIMIMGELDGTDYDSQITEYTSSVFMDAVSSSDAPTITREAIITLEVSEDGEKWLIYDIPSDLFDYNVVTEPSDDLYYTCAIEAINQLLNEGKIDQATYDALYSEFTGTPLVTTGEPTFTIGDNEYAADLVFADWYDYSTEDYCTFYTSANTDMIEFELAFGTNWDGLELIYEFYNVNGTNLSFSDSIVFGPEDYSAYLQYFMADGSVVPPDTYKIRVIMPDGTLVIESTIQVV